MKTFILGFFLAIVILAGFIFFSHWYLTGNLDIIFSVEKSFDKEITDEQYSRLYSKINGIKSPTVERIVQEKMADGKITNQELKEVENLLNAITKTKNENIKLEFLAKYGKPAE